ncbi:MAG: hypothetical protein Q8Q52_03475 [Acidimicrobiia bacterium]|nr:hypothetical protein [Acidimicrobiia bacterium]
MSEFTDCWARWMLRDRFGGDEEARRRSFESLRPIRDRVLMGGAITPGCVVVDVGCGDGLVGFGALALVGEPGRVLFTEVSPNPNAPTFGEAIHQALNSDQANQLEAYLRPLVETGTGGRARLDFPQQVDPQPDRPKSCPFYLGSARGVRRTAKADEGAPGSIKAASAP